MRHYSLQNERKLLYKAASFGEGEPRQRWRDWLSGLWFASFALNLARLFRRIKKHGIKGGVSKLFTSCAVSKKVGPVAKINDEPDVVRYADMFSALGTQPRLRIM